MSLFRKLSLAVVLIAVAVSAVDVAEEEGCVVTPSECTCAESPAAGACTRPTEGGKCLQGDCNPAHKCDCFGYELCSIQNCGKWTPAVSAILSRTSEFQCKYEADASKCRTVMVVMDTLESSDNAKSASTKYVDDVVEDEQDMAKSLKEALTFKIQTLNAFSFVTLRVDEVLPKELEEVVALADIVVEETQMIVKEIDETTAETSNAYSAMEKARNFRQEAMAHEALAKAEDLAEEKARKEAETKTEECVPCAEMKARIAKMRKDRRKAAKEAGTWAKKGRDARAKAKSKRLSVKNRKTKVQLTSAQCIAKAQKILNRLGGTFP